MRTSYPFKPTWQPSALSILSAKCVWSNSATWTPERQWDVGVLAAEDADDLAGTFRGPADASVETVRP